MATLPEAALKYETPRCDVDITTWVALDACRPDNPCMWKICTAIVIVLTQFSLAPANGQLLDQLKNGVGSGQGGGALGGVI
jgi:hypothetical protein